MSWTSGNSHSQGLDALIFKMQQAGVSTEAISNLLEATSKKLRAAETAHGEQALMRQQLALEEETRQIAVRLKSGEDVDV